MPAGRPTIYSIELAKRIGTLVSEGLGLPKICLMEDMPVRSTLCKWLVENREFSDIITQARHAAVEFEVDEARDISDSSEGDVKVLKRPDGTEYEKVDNENIQRSKLRVETRFNRARMLSPKKYGIKQEIEHTFHEPTIIKSPDGKIVETIKNA
jgi:hypothetical protein